MRTPMTASDASALPLRRYGGVRCRLIFRPSYSGAGYPDARRRASLRPYSVTTENTRGEARHGAGARIGLRPGQGRDGSGWRRDARRMTAEAVLCRTTVEWEPGAPSVGTLLGDSQCGTKAPRHVPPRGQHDVGSGLQRLARTQSALVTSQYFCFAKQTYR